MINEELSWLQKRMDPKGLTCFWRSYSENVHSAPLKWLNPTQVSPDHRKRRRTRSFAGCSCESSHHMPGHALEIDTAFPCSFALASLSSSSSCSPSLFHIAIALLLTPCLLLDCRRCPTRVTVSPCTGPPGLPRWTAASVTTSAPPRGAQIPPR